MNTINITPNGTTLDQRADHMFDYAAQ